MKPSGELYGGLDKIDLGTQPLQPGNDVLVLGCTCGVSECWPLRARITEEGGEIVWDRFRQPYHEDRDYERFGPFRFVKSQYEKALEKLAELG